MRDRRRNRRNDAGFRRHLTLSLMLVAGCDGAHSKSGPAPSAAPTGAPSVTAPAVTVAPSAVPTPAPTEPTKVEVKDEAMGTSLHFIAYTSAKADEAKTRAAISAAIAEMRRLEGLLSEWKPESEIGQVNAHAG